MKDVLNTESIQNLDKMEINQAKVTCIDLIKKTNTSEIKKQGLIRNITEASNIKRVTEIMWNCVLSGEKLAVANSNWQKRYA